MLVEQALRQILLNDAGVSAIVSGRIFPGTLAQSVTYPAIVYRLTRRASDPVMTPRGTSLPMSRYWLISTSKGSGSGSYQAAKLLDEAVRLALQGYNGTVTLTSSSPQVSVQIQGIFFDGSEDFYDDASETHQAGSLFLIWHNQQQP